MWQCMCYWEYCFKVHSFCQNFFDWLHKFAWIQAKVSLLLVEGKRLSHLSDSLKLLKVQENKVTLSFMCLLVINYSAYKKEKQESVKNKNANIGLSLHLENIFEQKTKWNKLELKLHNFFVGKSICKKYCGYLFEWIFA